MFLGGIVISGVAQSVSWLRRVGRAPMDYEKRTRGPAPARRRAGQQSCP